MGTFTYEGTIKVDFEDRLLLHLQTVIGNKLRRSESFFFSWRDNPSTGDGRTSVWLHSGAGLAFKYYGSRPPALNRYWLEALAYTANSPSGLRIVPEPADGGVELSGRAVEHAHSLN